MAIWYNWKCNACDYVYEGAAMPDVLADGYTYPLECKNCQIIFEFVVPPNDIYKLDNLSLKGDFGSKADATCPTCKRESLYIWDTDKNKCPKNNCEGILFADADSEKICT